MSNQRYEKAINDQMRLIAACIAGFETVNALASEHFFHGGKIDGDLEYAHDVLRVLPAVLPGAATYYVAPSISHVIDVAGAKLFEQVNTDNEIRLAIRPTEIPTTSGFALCEFRNTGLGLDGEVLSTPGGEPIVGFVWYITDDLLGITSLMDARLLIGYQEKNGFRGKFQEDPRLFEEGFLKRSAPIPITTHVWERDGGVFRPTERLVPNDPFDSLVYSFFHFIKDRIVVERASRPTRRRIERQGVLPEHGEIRVVRLRKSETYYKEAEEQGKGGAAGEEPSIEWTHRWVVSGHWRNQWYPSTQSHSLIWIDPHVKGPEEKPIIYKDQVYAVER